MTDNETISNWRGEPYIDEKVQDMFLSQMQTPPQISKQYDSDPAAWDEGIWNEILEKQISLEFVSYLADIAEETIGNDNIYLDYFMISSTPEQKARALAKAIEESK